jgi:hypothetical protein
MTVGKPTPEDEERLLWASRNGVQRKTIPQHGLMLGQTFFFHESRALPSLKGKEAMLVEHRLGEYLVQFVGGRTLRLRSGLRVWIRKEAALIDGQPGYRVEHRDDRGVVHRPMRTVPASEVVDWMTVKLADPNTVEIRVVRA